MNRDFAEMLDALSDAAADFLIVGAYDEAWPRRQMIEVEGRRLPFLSREDLIRNKAALGRPRDLADIDDVEKGG